MKKIWIIFAFLAIFLFGINAKAYDLNKDDEIYVGGGAIGIKINSGVEVVGTYGIYIDGRITKPWEDGKVKEGDIISSLNGIPIKTSADLLRALRLTNGDKTDLKLIRNNQEINTTITPAKNKQEYSLGLYVKDSIMGIGTLTYYIKEANVFGSLGHKIGNSEANNGEIYNAKVSEIIKPTRGQAGEKRAIIEDKQIGIIVENTDTGIHGKTIPGFSTSSMQLMGFKTREEVTLGKAQILTCINGKEIEAFDINITSLEKQHQKAIKGIVFEVTDSILLEKSGGIIQGMSGSPIIQDNKLIGAVTHVSLNDSKIGYGIYIEWMFEDMDVLVIE